MGEARSAVQDAIDRLLALEPAHGAAIAAQLPGTNLTDLDGYKMWGYDGYGALPPVSLANTAAADCPPVHSKDAIGLKPARSKERLKANEAQQRYRTKLRDRDAKAQSELTRLTEQLSDLKFETRQLAARQRMMLDLVESQEYHICMLINTRVCVDLEAKLLPHELAACMSTAGVGEITAEQARQWTLQQWVADYFPSFLKQMAKLLPAAEADPLGADSARLNAVVFIRRGTEARRSLYIQLHSVLLSWNLHLTQRIPAEHRPTPHFWKCVLEGLKLGDEQKQQVLEVRARVLLWLGKACELRADAYTVIGHDLTWQPDKVAEGRGVRMLRTALELERRASGHYFYEVLFDVLTPVQEVWLDAGPVCPPWNANLWAIGEALAASHGLPPAPTFEVLQRIPPAVQRFMPVLSGFQLLTVDCLAQGGGTQLKRGLLCCWYLTTGRSTPPGDPAIVLHPRPYELLDLTFQQLQKQMLPQCNPTLPLGSQGV